MTCLDELDLLDEDFSSSLSDITEALEARTLRLPVDEGTKVGVCVYGCVPSSFFLILCLFMYLSFGHRRKSRMLRMQFVQQLM